jgi:thermitase
MNQLLNFSFSTALSLIVMSAAFGQSRTAVPSVERYAVGHVLVQPRPGLPVAELDRIVQQHGGRRTGVIRRINVHIVALPPQANALAVVEALRRNPHLKFVEVDGQLPPALYPNDPQYASAWHLPKIGAPSAWDAAQGSGVTIAVLDSGIDTSHPDLQSRLVAGWNFYDGNADVGDVFGHGTAVAGIAAAAGNNGSGVASVSFGSKIMPLRVTDPSGNGYFSLMAAALVHAADNGARVANLSFLGVSLSDAVDSAAQYMRSKGGVVVVSGGSRPELRNDPVRSSLTVVAGTDTLDGWASSSWGDYVDVAAPGISIWTTKVGGAYGTVAGTSASSPIVAGVYALMMSARPDLPAGTLDEILFSTAQDLGSAGFDQYFGNGRVNAAGAVSKARQTTAGDTTPPSVAITAPAGGTVSGLFAVDVTASDNVGVAYVELYANDALVSSDSSAPYGFTFDTSAYSDGQLRLRARAYDVAGNAASSSEVAVAIGNDASPPTVSIVSPANGAVVSGSVTVNVAASDDQRVAKIELIIDGQPVAQSYGSSLSYVWNSNKGKGGKASSSIVARAYDAAGNGAAATISVNKR